MISKYVHAPWNHLENIKIQITKSVFFCFLSFWWQQPKIWESSLTPPSPLFPLYNALLKEPGAIHSLVQSLLSHPTLSQSSALDWPSWSQSCPLPTIHLTTIIEPNSVFLKTKKKAESCHYIYKIESIKWYTVFIHITF